MATSATTCTFVPSLGIAAALASMPACGSEGAFEPPPIEPARLGSDAIVGLTIEPREVVLEVENGAPASQTFRIDAHLADGSKTTAVAGNVTWSTSAAGIGSVDVDGTFRTSGARGGAVRVQAIHAGYKVAAHVVVKVHRAVDEVGNPAALDATRAATTQDPNVRFTYPFDRTVFPRGLGPVPLMWEGATRDDAYVVRVKSPYFTLEKFTRAPVLTASEWSEFEMSTDGEAELVVNRWDGERATRVAHQTWIIAPAALRGSVYYWAREPGRMLRIKPGRAAPEDFTKGLVGESSVGCNMKCHSVSADGSTLVGGGPVVGGSLDLKTSAERHVVGRNEDPRAADWVFPAITPDGRYILRNAFASTKSPKTHALFRTADGSDVATSGVGAELPFHPSFSPDGRKLVFVSGGPEENLSSTTLAGTLRAYDFDADATPMLSRVRDVVRPGNDSRRNVINWPTVSPDGRWVVYARMPRLENVTPQGLEPSIAWQLTARRPAQGGSELYMADLAREDAEFPLTALGGRGDPIASAGREDNYDYKPSFAPVAAGGYFWVVFHSRRRYGSLLAGSAAETKQLWIAAIDQNPKPGQDPSHPAFRLPAQSHETFNQSSVFALDVCRDDGLVCDDGTECCSGSCVLRGTRSICGVRQGCGREGDRCNGGGDCCGAASGVTCINRVCSEPAR